MPDIIEKTVNTVTADVTVTTTTETAAVEAPPAKMPLATARVVIRGWLQLTTGAATTTVTLRIRRGSGTGGTVVGDAVAITIGAAAGSNEQFSIVTSEERSNEESLIYTLTVQQAGATGNGTVLQASIEVEVLNG